MQHETKKYLEDIAHAAELIARFTAGKTLADYREDPMLRAAVERKFEIIGEALVQLAKRDAAVAARIGEHQRIVAFRNVLIHGYNAVDNLLVWGIVESKLAARHLQRRATLDRLRLCGG